MQRAARRGRPCVRALAAACLAVCCAATTAACSTAPSGGATVGPGGLIPVAASISAWGSILRQLGGTRVEETSIIANPDTDPHDYEPTVADARTVAESRLFVENGIGYDPWAAQSLAASPDAARRVIDVGHLVHVPDGGNPHRWYSPGDVDLVAAAITADLTRLDPSHAGYFAHRHAVFERRGLAGYHRLIRQIRTEYRGTPVGASESIFAPLAGALRLDLVTPPAFLRAISEGTDPSAQDKTTIDRQIASRAIKVYVYNSQNATPDVAAQVSAARAKGIPVATVTETLTPQHATFQQWQSRQLRVLRAALARASRE